MPRIGWAKAHVFDYDGRSDWARRAEAIFSPDGVFMSRSVPRDMSAQVLVIRHEPSD